MHAFYINLRRRVDRRAYMERQLATRGIEGERVEAVTPDDLSDDVKQRAAPWLSPNELACTYSHRAVWQLILDRGLPAALVLEDDCVLAPETAAVLAAPALLMPDVALLQLETHPSRAVLGKPVATAAPGIGRRRMISSSLGSCAYVITAAMAEACLARPELERLEMGKFLFSRNGPNLYAHGVFQVFPALATPLEALDTGLDGPQQSDLTATRHRGPAGSGGRSRKLTSNLSHLGRAIGVFGVMALLGARHERIPFAGTAQTARALLNPE